MRATTRSILVVIAGMVLLSLVTGNVCAVTDPLAYLGIPSVLNANKLVIIAGGITYTFVYNTVQMKFIETKSKAILDNFLDASYPTKVTVYNSLNQLKAVNNYNATTKTLTSYTLYNLSFAEAGPLFGPLLRAYGIVLPGKFVDYGADGKILRTFVADASGNFTSINVPIASRATELPKYCLAYDAAGRLVAQNNYVGAALTSYTLYIYYGATRLTSETGTGCDVNGRPATRTIYAYDGTGHLKSKMGKVVEQLMGYYNNAPVYIRTQIVDYINVGGVDKVSDLQNYTPYRDPSQMGGSGWTALLKDRTTYVYINGVQKTVYSDVIVYQSGTNVKAQETIILTSYFAGTTVIATKETFFDDYVNTSKTYHQIDTNRTDGNIISMVKETYRTPADKIAGVTLKKENYQYDYAGTTKLTVYSYVKDNAAGTEKTISTEYFSGTTVISRQETTFNSGAVNATYHQIDTNRTDGKLIHRSKETYVAPGGAFFKEEVYDYAYINGVQKTAHSDVKNYSGGLLKDRTIANYIYYDPSGYVSIKEVIYTSATNPASSYHRFYYYNDGSTTIVRTLNASAIEQAVKDYFCAAMNVMGMNVKSGAVKTVAITLVPGGCDVDVSYAGQQGEYGAVTIKGSLFADRDLWIDGGPLQISGVGDVASTGAHYQFGYEVARDPRSVHRYMTIALNGDTIKVEYDSSVASATYVYYFDQDMGWLKMAKYPGLKEGIFNPQVLIQGYMGNSLLAHRLLDRTRITEEEFDRMANFMHVQLFNGILYEDFITDMSSMSYANKLHDVIDLALSIDSARINGLLANLDHLVIMPWEEALPGGGWAPAFALSPDRVIVMASLLAGDPVDISDSGLFGLLGVLAHEAKHIKDSNDGILPPPIDAPSIARFEESAMAEDFHFTGEYWRANNRPAYNEYKFTLDHIADNDYNGPIAQLFTTPGDAAAYDAVMAPYTNAAAYICQTTGTSADQILYTGSQLVTEDKNGSPVEGYNIVFDCNGVTQNIFSSLNDQFLRYADQWLVRQGDVWVPEQDDIERLLDRSRITQAEFDSMKNSGWSYGMFDNVTYQEFLSDNSALAYAQYIEEAIALGSSIDTARFNQLLNDIDHIVFTDPPAGYPPQVCPSFARGLEKIIGTSMDPSSIVDPVMRARRILGILAHEGKHILDYQTGRLPMPTGPNDIAALARLEESAWQEDFYFNGGYWRNNDRSGYNLFKFILDHWADNNYTGIVAQQYSGQINPATGQPYTYDDVMRPYVAAENYICNNYSMNPNAITYVGSTIATIQKDGSPVQGYGITFNHAGTDYNIFSSQSGSLLYYNGQWLVKQGGIWIPEQNETERLLDRTTITRAEFDVIVTHGFFTRFGFQSITYNDFLSDPIIAEQINRVSEALQIGESIDADRLHLLLGTIEHVVILRLSPDAPQSMRAFPTYITGQADTIVIGLKSEDYESPNLQYNLLGAIVHEAGAILGGWPQGGPAIDEYNGMGEDIRFLGAWLMQTDRVYYNSFMFMYDRMPDNNFDNPIAQLLGLELDPGEIENVMAPYNNAVNFICQTTGMSADQILYIGSQLTVIGKDGSPIQGYQVAFDCNGTPQSIFASIDGTLLNYGGQWSQPQQQLLASQDSVYTDPDMAGKAEIESVVLQNKQSIPEGVSVAPQTLPKKDQLKEGAPAS